MRKAFIFILLFVFALSGCGDVPSRPVPGPEPIPMPAPGDIQAFCGGDVEMLTLPEKFAAENSKDRNTPALLVDIQNGVQESDQTTQSDWQANTGESNIDYTPTPPDAGNVILTQDHMIANFETGGDTWFQNQDDYGPPQIAQGFKVPVNSGVSKIAVYCKGGAVFNRTITRLKIYSGFPSSPTLLATSNTLDFTSSTGAWRDYTFSTPVQLTAGTQYHFLIEDVPTAPLDSPIWVYLDTNNGYADGTFYQYDNYNTVWVEYTGSDAYFRIHTSYAPSGYIYTQSMDLGETPTSNGEWVFEDITPAGTSVVYTAWASDTGAFAGEETSLGIVVDGDAITILKRYYRVKATLSSSAHQASTPTLQRIKATFDKFDTYADNMSLGYEPSVLGASSLTTTIDTFEKSTISQVTLTLALTQKVSEWLATKYPRNKIVKVKEGFVAPGWARTDYIDYFVGQVEDWSVSDYEVKLIVRDYSKSWKTKVPSKWESTIDDVTWTNQHPIDVCLDILRNRVNVRDSKLVTSSFDAIKTALSGWKVSRTITKEPVDADELLQELRLLMSAYFIPQPDGKIRIKRWDPNEAAIDSLNDDNFMIRDWQGNAASLINQTHIYFEWDGDGNEAADFTEFRAGVDGASQTNWSELRLKEIKDKWTLAADVSQIQDLEGKILARYANPPAIIPGDVSRSKIALEVGDIVAITTKKAPSTDMNGISNVKFQIVNRNLDHKRDTIRLKLLRV